MTQYVQIENGKKYAVISFKDLKNVDANSAPRVKAEINGVLTEETRNLIIDLKGISFIDSSGFGSLISVLKTIRSRSGKMLLCNVTPEVQELMDLMQLLAIFDLKPTLADAKAVFN